MIHFIQWNIVCTTRPCVECCRRYILARMLPTESSTTTHTTYVKKTHFKTTFSRFSLFYTLCFVLQSHRTIRTRNSERITQKQPAGILLPASCQSHKNKYLPNITSTSLATNCVIIAILKS